MSDDRIAYHCQFIRQQIAALREDSPAIWEAIDAALEDLQATYEHIETNLESVIAAEAELLQRKQYYQDLFELFPMASLVTDANGVILEVNHAIAQLLNVAPSDLVGHPLAVFVAEADRASLRAQLGQLSAGGDTQTWHTRLCPRGREPVMAELRVAVAQTPSGLIEQLRVGVYSLDPSSTSIASLMASAPALVPAADKQPPLPLPQSLDGLRVLVVDDEADIREFLTVVLEAHGIGVRAVASAAAALEELDRFRPDVLLSDIRMPGGDGYSLIEQIRALEAERGGYLPAAAITAYLSEDPEKVLQAGFEAHLYKMVQPNEWVEMVARLARQTPSQE